MFSSKINAPAQFRAVCCPAPGSLVQFGAWGSEAVVKSGTRHSLLFKTKTYFLMGH